MIKIKSYIATLSVKAMKKGFFSVPTFFELSPFIMVSLWSFYKLNSHQYMDVPIWIINLSFIMQIIIVILIIVTWFLCLYMNKTKYKLILKKSKFSKLVRMNKRAVK